MSLQISRVSNFSSSAIHALTSSGRAKGSIGKPFETYVRDKVIEYKSGRAINNDHSARPTTWGTYAERFAFKKIGIEYKLDSKKRVFHERINRWCGATDLLSNEKVGDIKCPYTLTSFGSLVESLSECDESEIGEVLKKEKKEYYWQLVSNAILNDKNIGELILFMPYKSELQEIKDSVQHYVGKDIHKFIWIANSLDEELPYLEDECEYKSIYSFSFDIPKEDKAFLTERVILANYEMDKKLGLAQ